MRIVVLGPPGIGKGTLAGFCEDRLGVPHLSTGELFRQAIERRSRLGRQVARYVRQGRLVPDEVVVRVMTERLRDDELLSAFLMDGFPRTVAQARGLDRFLARHRHPLDGAVLLRGPERLLIARLSGRRVCPRCGANYHVRTMRPKRAGLCDRCGTRLVIREDDTVKTVRRRLSINRRQAKPLLAYYRRHRMLYPVDGRGSIEHVFARTLALFRREGWVPVRGGRDDRVEKF